MKKSPPKTPTRRRSRKPTKQPALAGGASPDLSTVLKWLIAEIKQLTLTRPVQKSSKLSDLRVPLPRLTKDVNAKWFPNGGGFASIDGSTTVGNLAFAISERLKPRPAFGGAAPPDLSTVEDWLIAEIEGLTLTRPVLKSSKLSDVKVPLERLTKDVNSRWFPNDGGFASIDGSTTVGDLAFAITQRLGQ